MNPIAIFFIVFFLSCIAFATLGLEFAITNPDLINGITYGDILGISGMFGVLSSVGEVLWSVRGKRMVSNRKPEPEK